jgi:TolB-like protein/Tfp pilus assembly protein PilF
VHLEFGAFRLDPGEQRLTKSGEVVSLPPKAFQLLQLLAENTGKLAEKEAILKALWPDSFVEEANLAKLVFLLRKLIGEDAIETVPKRGYRFLLPVHKAEPVAAAPPKPSIAVLPFDDLSPNRDQEYFCEGVAEEIRYALAKVEGVAVASRSVSFPWKGKDPREAGRALGVTAILEGSVRLAGGLLRIAAQLVNAGTGYQMWARQFDRPLDAVFLIQEEIAAAVTAALEIRLLAPPRIERRSANAEAYALYLRGRFLWARRPAMPVEQALRSFEQAVELDPGFAAAYAGIADVYATLGSWEAGAMAPDLAFRKANEAALQALALDPRCAEAHTTLSYVALHHQWNPARSVGHFEDSARLDPQSAIAHHWVAHTLVCQGRFQQALHHSLKAVELESADLIINGHLSWHYSMTRQPALAEQEARRLLRMDEQFHWNHYFLGAAREFAGDWDQAIAAYRRAVETSSGNAVMQAWLAHALAHHGAAQEARDLESKLAGKPGLFAYERALIRSALGERTEAFRLLEEAREDRSAWIAYIRLDPRLDPLRSDPAFAALLSRVDASVR